MSDVTCREDHILGDEIVVDDGELGKLNPPHACDSTVPPSPVELDVICGVAVCGREKTAKS